MAQSYAISHPGKVLYYMADDYANTNCTQLSSWASANGMGNSNAFFSDAAVSMSDYGTPGMPKVIVVGCSSHKVFYNENYTAAGIGDAINEALEECNSTYVKENSGNYFNLSLFPNPTQDITNISFEIEEASEVNVDIVNITGQTVLNISNSYLQSGMHKIQFQTESLRNGLYLLRIQSDVKSQLLKFSIAQ